MPKPSETDGIAKSYERIYDHAQRVRVKAWGEIQAGDLEDAKRLLLIADLYDRLLIKVLARNEPVWKRE